MHISFGATSPTSGANCPASGSWERWCDCMWPGGALNQKCKSKPLSFATPAPWTAAGAAARGIPHGDIPQIPGITAPAIVAAPPPAVVASSDEGVFGLPRTIALAGGGVLALGLVAFLLMGKK